MNRTDFNIFVEEVFERSRNVLVKKDEEYTAGKDVFHVFNNAVGLSLHNESCAVAWEMMVKHLQSIKDIIDKINKRKECSYISDRLLNDKFGDAINYFILIEGIIREQLGLNNKNF